MTKPIKKGKSEDKKTNDSKLIDQKLLNSIWKLCRTRKSAIANKERIALLLMEIIDSCPYILFNSTLIGIAGIGQTTYYNHIMIDPDIKIEIQTRLTRNQALETLNVLEKLAQSSHANALIVRLKLLSEDCRSILNEGYAARKQEKLQEHMSRQEKLEEGNRLLEKLGTDILSMRKPVNESNNIISLAQVKENNKGGNNGNNTGNNSSTTSGNDGSVSSPNSKNLDREAVRNSSGKDNDTNNEGDLSSRESLIKKAKAKEAKEAKEEKAKEAAKAPIITVPSFSFKEDDYNETDYDMDQLIGAL